MEPSDVCPRVARGRTSAARSSRARRRQRPAPQRAPGESTTESRPKTSALAAASTSESRASPSAAIANALLDSAAIRPSETTSVASPIAIAIPGSPHAARRPSPSGMHTVKPTSASGRSRRRRSATKTSGNVTAKPTQATIQGERYTTRWPSWRPTCPCTRSRARLPTIRPPTSANTPAAAPTIERLTQPACTTWRPAASASMPRRVSGAEEMTPSENAVAATSVEAARYAYEKLVTLPTPRCAAKRRRAGSSPGARAARPRPGAGSTGARRRRAARPAARATRRGAQARRAARRARPSRLPRDPSRARRSRVRRRAPRRRRARRSRRARSPRRRCRSCRARRARSPRAQRAAARTQRARARRAPARRCAQRSGGRLPVMRSPSGWEKTTTSADTGAASTRNASAIRAALADERSLRGGTRQVGDDDHPERLGGQHEHEVDARRRRGSRPSRADRPNFCASSAPAACGRERDDDLGEAGQHPAAKRARRPEDARLARLHGSDQSRRLVLERRRTRAAAPGLRRRSTADGPCSSPARTASWART